MKYRMKYRLMGLLAGWILMVSMGMTPALAKSIGIGKDIHSDHWIAWRVDALLQNNERLDYRQVKVSCKNGEVTLEGSVFTEYEKGQAELVAEDVSGVKAVKSEILVVESVNTNFALAKNVRSQILEDPLLNVTALNVGAEEGDVELHGIVSAHEAKEKVGEIVRLMPGVKHVTNDILIESKSEK